MDYKSKIIINGHKKQDYTSTINKILDYGIEHLNLLREPFNQQIAVILIDNAVELIIKAYLGEYGFRSVKSLVSDLKQKIPPNFLIEKLDKIVPYHEKRNNLYHDLVKKYARRKMTFNYASIALYLFEKLIAEKKEIIKIKREEWERIGKDFSEIWERIEEQIKIFFFDISNTNFDYSLLRAIEVLDYEHILGVKSCMTLLEIEATGEEIRRNFDISWDKVNEYIKR